MAEAPQAGASVQPPASPATQSAEPGPARRFRGYWLLALGLVVFGGVLAAYIADVAHHLPEMAAMRDLVVYRAGGLITRHVSPPFNPAQSASLYSWQGAHGVSFTYTPLAAILFAGGSILSWLALRWAMTAASLTALLLSAWLMFRALGYTDRRVRAALTLLACAAGLVIEPVQQTLALGQINLLLMLLAVVDLMLLRRHWWTGAGIGLAAGIKLVPLIFIPYLLLTGRYRQAAVAAGTFAATIGIGYAVLPADSARYWWDRLFLNANRIVFLGTRGNQSLRGMVTRFAGSVHGATHLWLAVAAVVAIAGLVIAAALHRAGHPVPGMLACALVGLLVSPLTWDHHWVWAALGVAYLAHLAVRSRGLGRLAWSVATAVLFAVFAAFPAFWSPQASLTPAGWVWYGPTQHFAYGDNPAYREYHWNVVQILTGNSYVFAGLLALGALAVAAITLRRPMVQAWAATARKAPRLP